MMEYRNHRNKHNGKNVVNEKNEKNKKNKKPEYLNAKIQSLPKLPGVYLMKDETGNIIYIGKAVNLKRRVKSYFQSNHKDNRKLEMLVADIRGLEYIQTDTELEALLLECKLIKKHKPHYNAAMKNDSQYPYIKITNEPYPVITTSLTIEADGAHYYGPYKKSDNILRVTDIFRRIWGIRVCDTVLSPGTIKPPCLNYHIKKCSAPCCGNISQNEYLESINKIKKFFSGKHRETLRKVRDEMNLASENLLFELAAQYRDNLQDLKQFAYRQKILLNALADNPYLVFTSSHDNTYLVIFFIRFGKVAASTKIDRDTLETPETNRFKEQIIGFLSNNYKKPCHKRSYYERDEIDEILILHSWLKHSKADKILADPKAVIDEPNPELYQ